MEGDRGERQKEEQKRAQGDEEVAPEHKMRLGESLWWDERFPVPPCGLRVWRYRIGWVDEKGIHSGVGDLFGGVRLRAVGHA